MVGSSAQDVAAGGAAVAGFPIGILCLETRHPLLPGNVQHARSFNFPVVYASVPVEDPWRLLHGDPTLAEPIIAAARRLVAASVRGVVGACGSFGYYQRLVAEAVPVPVMLSPMLLVPLLLNVMSPHRRLGVICGSISSMNERVFAACGIASVERVAFAAMCGRPAFDGLLQGDMRLDVPQLRAETLAAAASLVDAHRDLGAILLQCSDLPPFAADVQRATGLPVFDMTSAIAWLCGAVECRPYHSG